VKDIALQIATWKYNKRWVYSATYDEGLAELHRFVVPVHDRLGIPGHVEAVAGHLGVIRQLSTSSFNGMRHMSGGELRELTERGWGIGNHSWSHGVVEKDVERELGIAKRTIEEAAGYPVTLYTAPGDNHNMSPAVLDALPRYGYLGGMSITDDVNGPDFGLWINRSPLHEKFSDLYDSAFDAFKRIDQAKKQGAWVIDYLHCPLEKAIHDYKDVGAAHHAERLETVAEQGKYDCWFANPDRVADYRYLRGAAVIEKQADGVFTLGLSGMRKEIVCKELTFTLQSSCAAGQLAAEIDGRAANVHEFSHGCAVFTVPVRHGTVIRVYNKGISDA